MFVAPASTAFSRPSQWLTDALVSARLFDPLQLRPYLSEFRVANGPDNAEALARFLIDGGVLTDYQAERALAGDAARLGLGSYLLVEPIGSGSLGTVYLAVNRSDRKRYAVKILPLRSLWNVHLAKQQVAMFARLPAHPAVVPFVDIDTAGGCHYLAWPFVLGQTLAEIVRVHGPLPTDRAIGIAAQVTEGLLLCHTHDVSHGLLKPSNILIGNDGQARLLDLGIGAVLSENISDDESMLDTISTANSTMGMLEFAAPETLNSPTLRAPSGDIYSIGCTLYFTLTGGMPFPDGNAVDKILAHQTQKPRSIRIANPTVPAWLETLIFRMMSKDPADRPTTAELLAALLNEAYAPPQFQPQRECGPKSPSPNQPGATPWLIQPVMRAGATETLSSFLATDQSTESYLPRVIEPFPSDPTDPLQESSAEIPAPHRPTSLSMLTPGQPGRFRLQNDATMRLDSEPPAESIPMPVNYSKPAVAESTERSAIEPPPLPSFARTLAFRFFRKLAFWMPHADIVQVSVFGPPTISPGDSVSIQIFAHTPDSFESVRTLSKAFHQNGELLATGYVQRGVAHGQRMGIHLGVVNAGLDRSEVELTWRGQPQPRRFELHVPWESPAGPTPSVLSIGLNHILSGRIAFTLQILPRR